MSISAVGRVVGQVVKTYIFNDTKSTFLLAGKSRTLFLARAEKLASVKLSHNKLRREKIEEKCRSIEKEKGGIIVGSEQWGALEKKLENYDNKYTQLYKKEVWLLINLNAVKNL